VGVGRAVAVAVALGVTLGVVVSVAVAVAVAVAVGVGETVTVGVAVAVAVAVAVGVALAGAVGVGVHPAKMLHLLMLTVSTRQPSLEPVVSLTMRQRRRPSVWIVGRFTTVVMKPSELPLQAGRPAIGLPRSVLIVRL
jgi:hypothetical protein